MLTVGGGASRAWGQEAEPGLNWVRLDGAQSCISASELAERVEARVGRVLFAPASDAGLSVDGRVAPTRASDADLASGWHVVLELSARDGEVLGRRELRFEGGDCSVIDEAVMLVIAVTLYPNTGLLGSGIPLDPSTAASLQALFGQEPTDPDPTSFPRGVGDGETRGAAATAGPAAGPSIEAPQEGPQDAASAELGRGRRPPRHAIGLGAVAGYGYLPGVRAGALALLDATPGAAWPLQASLLWFPKTLERAGSAGARATFELWMVGLSLCPLRPDWWPALSLCAGGELGGLGVVSTGFAEGELDRVELVGSVIGSVRVDVQLGGPLWLRAASVLAVPLDQRRFVAQTRDGSVETLFRIPQLAARVELGLMLEL